jgi:hypothetical protein
MKTLTDQRRREEAIEKWMLTIIDDGGTQRFDDLHIDRIDSAWQHPDRWVEGGLEALRLALVVRDRNRLPFTVALAFSLKSGSHPLGVDFQTRPELQERLNWSSPSLYLFHRGDGPRNQIAPEYSAQELNPSIFGIQEAIGVCYYLEFLQQGADEYGRSVCIEG